MADQTTPALDETKAVPDTTAPNPPEDATVNMIKDLLRAAPYQEARYHEQFSEKFGSDTEKLDHFRQVIPQLLEKNGIVPSQHPRAMGYLLHEIEDPKILEALANQLEQFTAQRPGFNEVQNYQGFEKATWMIAALATPHDSPARIAAFSMVLGGSLSGIRSTIEAFSDPDLSASHSRAYPGIAIPNLDGVTDPGNPGDPPQSPTVAYVAGYALNHAKDRIKALFSSDAALSLEKMGQSSDPDLVQDLLSLNRDLREAYVNRAFKGEMHGLCGDTPKGSPSRPTECTLQFAAATSTTPNLKAQDTIPRPDSEIIQEIKFGDNGWSPLELGMVLRLLIPNSPTIKTNPSDDANEPPRASESPSETPSPSDNPYYNDPSDRFDPKITQRNPAQGRAPC